MEYLKEIRGGFEKLPKRNVDFGGGLERIAAATIGSSDVFKVDVLVHVIQEIERLSNKKYGDNEADTHSFRVIADHLRAAIFMIADGVNPGNTERNYFVRRLLRRAVRYMDKLGMKPYTLHTLVSVITASYDNAYSNLKIHEENIAQEVRQEEERFRSTLEKGLKRFNEIIETTWNGQPDEKILQGNVVFDLYQTYGFPFELIKEIAEERGLVVDESWFRKDLEAHREKSRAGSEQKFKGGLADTAEQTVRLHTAHHLLLRALQIVLGPEVHQRGSNITQERLRIDFSYGQKMTDEQKREVERIVNEKIDEGLPVIRSEMSKAEAEKLGAEHEFGQTYPDRVSVYSVGPKEATQENPQFDKRYSIEFCGGLHVENTSELSEGGKQFKIQKEEAVAAGIRRIKAVLANIDQHEG
jgi:alanyl-tRNA synthetase